MYLKFLMINYTLELTLKGMLSDMETVSAVVSLRLLTVQACSHVELNRTYFSIILADAVTAACERL
jgi:hypothetical protein